MATLTLNVVAVPKDAVEVAGYRYVTFIRSGEYNGFVVARGQFEIWNMIQNAGIACDWAAVEASLIGKKAWKGSVETGNANVHALLREARAMNVAWMEQDH